MGTGDYAYYEGGKTNTATSYEVRIDQNLEITADSNHLTRVATCSDSAGGWFTTIKFYSQEI